MALSFQQAADFRSRAEGLVAQSSCHRGVSRNRHAVRRVEQQSGARLLALRLALEARKPNSWACDVDVRP